MTKYELRKQLLSVLADLYLLQSMLEHAVRAGVPPDAQHVVQLHSVAKQIASILAKLDTPSDTALPETA